MTVTDEAAAPAAEREVGKARTRKEDQRLITGRSRYTDNITLPGMLHLAMVRSPYAHAKVTAIRTDEAKAAPGVVLVATGAEPADVSRVVTSVADAVHRRLAELAEQRLGPPPAPYAWVSLGSQARHELTLGSDQDHAIVRAGGPDDYYAALAEDVTAGLERCGYARCDGDVMATNPRWRGTIEEWRREFAHWLDQPTPESILHAGIFFDMRAVHGDTALVDRLREPVVAAAPQAQRFLAYLTKHAVDNEPPLGLFRGLVVHTEGSHRDELDVTALPGIGCRLHRVRAFGVDVLRTPESPARHLDEPFFWGAYVMAPWTNRADPSPMTIAGSEGEPSHGSTPAIFAKPLSWSATGRTPSTSWPAS